MNSLRLLFLEIAHWNVLPQLMGFKRWPGPSSQNVRVRGWLLQELNRPSFKGNNPLLELPGISGEKYWRVVSRCLEAHGAKGMYVEEDSDQSHTSEVGPKLHLAFTEHVLDKLKTILI
ncbi:prion-inhibition and propagation-domain-containing protein [Penicillium taxi]|uniref:prion-inhibition and propagation-domain-containing protein n=1 Tax=Penicillium taxi TaxID=168475 RepID=UPI002545273B|nr:prion-inhibition and propagation-domain-containing protein [Penicillium taxi]KAJ5885539.1 prion-inhibition and propagation-domain-containing protein [Penicillium taxi]